MLRRVISSAHFRENIFTEDYMTKIFFEMVRSQVGCQACQFLAESGNKSNWIGQMLVGGRLAAKWGIRIVAESI